MTRDTQPFRELLGTLQTGAAPGYVLHVLSVTQHIGWVEAVRRMQVDGGTIYNTLTVVTNNDGSYSTSQSSVFVPDTQSDRRNTS